MALELIWVWFSSVYSSFEVFSSGQGFNFESKPTVDEDDEREDPAALSVESLCLVNQTGRWICPLSSFSWRRSLWACSSFNFKASASTILPSCKKISIELENYQALLWWIVLFHIFSPSFKLNSWNSHFYSFLHAWMPLTFGTISRRGRYVSKIRKHVVLPNDPL